MLPQEPIIDLCHWDSPDLLTFTLASISIPSASSTIQLKKTKEEPISHIHRNYIDVYT